MRVEAEPAVAPPPGNPRFPLFDGLRAIAAMSVLVYHTSFYSGAHAQSAFGPLLARLNIGVAIFFVISGFLLYRPFVAARMDAKSGPKTLAYARRRFLRIVPAYWLALSILIVYPGVGGLWSDAWPVYYGFGQVYSQDTILGGIGPAWTLCTEAVFYAFLPLYAFVLARWVGGRRDAIRIELALLAVGAVASIVLRTYMIGDSHGTLGLTFPSMFAWFAVGMSLAIVSAAAAHGSMRAPRVPALPAWAAAIALYVVLCYVLGKPQASVFATKPTYFNAGFEFVMSAAIAGLIALPAVFGHGGAPRRFLALPGVAWLGLVSYGIYLWHEAVARWLLQHDVLQTFDFAPFVVMTILAIAITVPIAAASYYLFERPILRFKDGRPRRLVRRRAAVPAAAPATESAPAEPGDRVAP